MFREGFHTAFVIKYLKSDGGLWEKKTYQMEVCGLIDLRVQAMTWIVRQPLHYTFCSISFHNQALLTFNLFLFKAVSLWAMCFSQECPEGWTMKQIPQSQAFLFELAQQLLKLQ